MNNVHEIWMLNYGGNNAEWSKLDQTLWPGRYGLSAFLIPDHYVNCH